MSHTDAKSGERAKAADEIEPSNVQQDPWPWNRYSQRDRRVFMFVLFFVGAINYADRNVIGVLLEQIKTEFHVSDTTLGLLSGISFALIYATLGIPVARWADRGDRKIVITLCLSVWSLMTVLCGFAMTFWQLAAARFGVGAGEAGAIPPGQSLLADYYPPDQRARAIGVFMMSSTAGYALGLVLGGFVAQHYGWRAAFVTFGLSGLVLVPLTHLTLKEPRRAPQFARPLENVESTVGAIYALLAKPAYRNILGAMVLLFFISYGSLVFIVSLMIRVHGMNVAQAGALYGAISAVGGVIGAVGGGALADRLAARDIAWLSRVAAGGLIVSVPLYELALWSSNPVLMAPLFLVATVVLTSVAPPAFSAIHVVCGSSRRALAIALVYFFANLFGLGLGPVVAGALSDTLAVDYGPGEGLRRALMIVTGVLLPAGWLMWRAGQFLKENAES